MKLGPYIKDATVIRYLLMDKAAILKTEAEMVKIAAKLLILQSKWL